MSFEQGPYVTVAAICNEVLQEKDNVLSLIRVVDRVGYTYAAGGGSDAWPPFTSPLTLVLIMKAGDAAGRRFALKLRPVSPDGTVIGESELPFEFADTPNYSATFVVKLAVTFIQPGVHWIDVLLDDGLLTRIPLQVDYQPLSPGASGQDPAPG